MQDNLTSTSTTDSLSAKQGSVLRERTNNYVKLHSVTLTLSAGATSQKVTVTPPDGYVFLCWTMVQTDGWVGAGYMADAGYQTAYLWLSTPAPANNTKVRCWYLVQKNNI